MWNINTAVKNIPMIYWVTNMVVMWLKMGIQKSSFA